MFGDGKTYFADSPVVIDISGLEWPGTSPFNVVNMYVMYDGKEAGFFRDDTGGQTTATFNIKSALAAIWAGYEFDGEETAANAALTAVSPQQATRPMRRYSLQVTTEYMADDDGGVFTRTGFGPFGGGQCLIGGLTEWERSLITDDTKRDVSALEHTNVRNGDASTKPTSSPERVGKSSITSWTDVQAGYTKSIFYPAPSGISLPAVTGDDDDVAGSQTGWTGHAPIVLRDSIDYVDFLFINRRGAIETCSGQTLEAMGINVKMQQYSRTERPSFKPTRSLMAIGSDGRRSWQMSSGYVTREWAEWWTMEFLGGKRKQWWMKYKGPGMTAATYVPVIVTPAKNDVSIYDRTKQQMPHVDFTVTLALEG